MSEGPLEGDTALGPTEVPLLLVYTGMTGPLCAKAPLGMRKANWPSGAGTTWKPPNTLAASPAWLPSLQGAPPGGAPRPGDGHERRRRERRVLGAAGARRGGGGACKAVRLPGIGHGVDLGHAVGQVAEQPGAHLGVNALARGQEAGHLVHALAEAGAVFPQYARICAQRGGHLRALQVPEVLHGHLQDIGLLQLGMPRAIFLKSIQNQSFQLAQAFIYSRSSSFLHDWL